MHVTEIPARQIKQMASHNVSYGWIARAGHEAIVVRVFADGFWDVYEIGVGCTHRYAMRDRDPVDFIDFLKGR